MNSGINSHMKNDTTCIKEPLETPFPLLLANVELIHGPVVMFQAEARLAAKRQARAEAREIRMRELERMQRENEDGEKVYDIYSTPGTNLTSCRESSEICRLFISSKTKNHF